MDKSVILANLKTMLRLKNDDQDDLLNLIIDNTGQALSFKLGLVENEVFPTALNYILLEVCVRRYNRVKNEGMASYTQEGESITFNSSDFDDFEDDIAIWKKRHNKDVKSNGTVQFINPYRSDYHAF